MKHEIRYEKASPSDLITVNLLIKDVEQEGIIEHYVNGEKIGSIWISQNVIEDQEGIVGCPLAEAMDGFSAGKGGSNCKVDKAIRGNSNSSLRCSSRSQTRGNTKSVYSLG